MVKHETGFARVARDHYPTREAWVTEALLDHVDVAGLKIWEMAAGAGDMAEVLKAAGAWVFCSDIADYGYSLDAIFDFTSADMPPVMDFAGMITNPPGGSRNHLAVKFIEVGLTRIPRRIPCIIAAGRLQLWRHPATVLLRLPILHRQDRFDPPYHLVRAD
jgi:hypothetical protein